MGILDIFKKKSFSSQVASLPNSEKKKILNALYGTRPRESSFGTTGITDELFNLEDDWITIADIVSNVKKMMSESTIGSSMMGYKNILKQFSFTIECEDNYVKDFVQNYFDNIFELKNNIDDILLFLNYGFIAYERTLQFRGKWIYPILYPIHPATINNIEFHNDGKIRVLNQLTESSELNEVTNPIIFFTLNSECGNPFGRSLLYHVWKDYNYLYKHERLLLEKEIKSSGFLHIKAPYTTDSQEFADLKSSFSQASAVGDGVVITSDKVEAMYQFVDTKNNNNMQYIKMYREQILMGLFTQFTNLGQSNSGGSRALARDTIIFFEKGLQGILNIVAEVLNKKIINPMVLDNFKNKIPCKILLSLNADIDENLVIQAITSGIIEKDNDIENSIRTKLGFAKKQEEKIDIKGVSFASETDGYTAEKPKLKKIADSLNRIGSIGNADISFLMKSLLPKIIENKVNNKSNEGIIKELKKKIKPILDKSFKESYKIGYSLNSDLNFSDDYENEGFLPLINNIITGSVIKSESQAFDYWLSLGIDNYLDKLTAGEFAKQMLSQYGQSINSQKLRQLADYISDRGFQVGNTDGVVNKNEYVYYNSLEDKKVCERCLSDEARLRNLRTKINGKIYEGAIAVNSKDFIKLPNRNCLSLASGVNRCRCFYIGVDL